MQQQRAVAHAIRSLKTQLKDVELSQYEWTTLYNHLVGCYVAGIEEGKAEQMRLKTHSKPVVRLRMEKEKGLLTKKRKE